MYWNKNGAPTDQEVTSTKTNCTFDLYLTLIVTDIDIVIDIDIDIVIDIVIDIDKDN